MSSIHSGSCSRSRYFYFILVDIRIPFPPPPSPFLYPSPSQMLWARALGGFLTGTLCSGVLSISGPCPRPTSCVQCRTLFARSSSRNFSEILTSKHFSEISTSRNFSNGGVKEENGYTFDGGINSMDSINSVQSKVKGTWTVNGVSAGLRRADAWWHAGAVCGLLTGGLTYGASFGGRWWLEDRPAFVACAAACLCVALVALRYRFLYNNSGGFGFGFGFGSGSGSGSGGTESETVFGSGRGVSAVVRWFQNVFWRIRGGGVRRRVRQGWSGGGGADDGDDDGDNISSRSGGGRTGFGYSGRGVWEEEAEDNEDLSLLRNASVHGLGHMVDVGIEREDLEAGHTHRGDGPVSAR